MSDAMAPGLSAPDGVTVLGPGEEPAWFAFGRVTGRAPYSIRVRWEGPKGEEAQWFVWEPGRTNHARQHGVNADHAIRLEPSL